MRRSRYCRSMREEIAHVKDWCWLQPKPTLRLLPRWCNTVPDPVHRRSVLVTPMTYQNLMASGSCEIGNAVSSDRPAGRGSGPDYFRFLPGFRNCPHGCQLILRWDSWLTILPNAHWLYPGSGHVSVMSSFAVVNQDIVSVYLQKKRLSAEPGWDIRNQRSPSFGNAVVLQSRYIVKPGVKRVVCDRVERGCSR